MKKYLLKLMLQDLAWEKKRLNSMESWNSKFTDFAYKEKMIKQHTNKIKKVERYIERIEKLFP